ncbi:MAG: site-2 protease family protein [Candidatus Omnitrophota bacterium]
MAGALLGSVIAHEIAHGWTAFFFGDDTARRSGRLSLNPLSHLDLMGTIALFIVGFGWAKPVPVNFGRLKPARAGLICVSLAGCVTNIAIAAVCLIIMQNPAVKGNSMAATVLYIVARINIILGAFNLIPLPPLDGSKILMGFLPKTAQAGFAKVESLGFIVLVLLLFTGFLNPVIDIAQKIVLLIINPVVKLFG